MLREPYALWDEVAEEVGFVRPARASTCSLYVTGAAGGRAAPTGSRRSTSSSRSPAAALYVRDTATSLIAHELGHNFSLGHSSAQQCDADGRDRHLPDVAYARLLRRHGRLLEPDRVADVAQAWSLLGVPRRRPATVLYGESAHDGDPARRRSEPGSAAWSLVGPRRLYWLEYRTAAGQDAWLRPTTTGSAACSPASCFAAAAAAGVRRPSTCWTAPVGAGGMERRPPGGPAVEPAGPRRRRGLRASPSSPWTPPSATIRRRAGVSGPAGRRSVRLDPCRCRVPRATVRGWALDLNTPARPLDVRVTVDGRGPGRSSAGAVRADIGPPSRTPAAGTASRFPTPVTPGWHTVCAQAIGPEPVAAARRWAAGWSRTPPRRRSAPSTRWRCRADADRGGLGPRHRQPDGGLPGPPLPRRPCRSRSPRTDARADVGRAHPTAGSAHGFTFTTRLTPGSHRVCAYAIDTAGRGSTALGCRTVTSSRSCRRAHSTASAVSGGDAEPSPAGPWTPTPRR